MLPPSPSHRPVLIDLGHRPDGADRPDGAQTSRLVDGELQQPFLFEAYILGAPGLTTNGAFGRAS